MTPVEQQTLGQQIAEKFYPKAPNGADFEPIDAKLRCDAAKLIDEELRQLNLEDLMWSQ